MPQSDEHDPLAALHFDEPGTSAPPAGEQRAALDFSGGDDDGDDDTATSALADYAPGGAQVSGTELDAMVSQTSSPDDESSEDEEDAQFFTVANPADTVAVSALIDGRTQRVELSEMLPRMTGSELSAELLTLAGLAQQKGLAGQRSAILENPTAVEVFRNLGDAVGMDGGELLAGFTEFDMGLPTPEQAEAAQVEAFAGRHVES